jgi:hypothetical protein
VEIAVWSVDNQEDKRTFYPTTLDDAVAVFQIPPPAQGWTGEILAMQIYVRGQFIYQHLWRIQN